MKRFKKYNDLVPARKEFDKFCLSHTCDKCPLYPSNENDKNLGCFGSFLNEEVQEVVMCKDCKFRFTETCFAKHETADNDFCSNGFRMDGEER